jgi:hypothetical protein
MKETVYMPPLPRDLEKLQQCSMTTVTQINRMMMEKCGQRWDNRLMYAVSLMEHTLKDCEAILNLNNFATFLTQFAAIFYVITQ